MKKAIPRTVSPFTLPARVASRSPVDDAEAAADPAPTQPPAPAQLNDAEGAGRSSEGEIAQTADA
jgi:hypothetical protein